jgi:tetrahydromethanopterin S-methyltransferase subunit G
MGELYDTYQDGFKFGKREGRGQGLLAGMIIGAAVVFIEHWLFPF